MNWLGGIIFAGILLGSVVFAWREGGWKAAGRQAVVVVAVVAILAGIVGFLIELTEGF